MKLSRTIKQNVMMAWLTSIICFGIALAQANWFATVAWVFAFFAIAHIIIFTD